ncbi:MAG: hypothetical protein AAF108_03200 [Planctomycetota bacterium]
MLRTSTIAALLAVAGASSTSAQFNPANGQWGKTTPTDIRIMTYNIEDGICRNNGDKDEAFGNWAALARTVAAIRPDILILQEAGDNSGNGSPGGGDNVSQLTTTIELFFNGGPDPFVGGEVTEFVQKYAPGYELENIFVSSVTDGFSGFNRNVIVSRWDFDDLNGDGFATTSSFSTVNGTSGIRGIQFAEIDLPDSIYPGNIIVSNAHLKAGGSSSDASQRAQAATAMATYLWNFYNGAGTQTVDPNNLVNDFPFPSSVIDPLTPIIWGGDYNEDESTNGKVGPVQISIENTPAGGGEGTDADGSNAVADTAVDFFTGSKATLGGSKLDYMMHQDSVINVRNQFVFNSGNIPINLMPPELVGFGPIPTLLDGRSTTSAAADHRPVVVDYILPLQAEDFILPGEFSLLSPPDGSKGISSAVEFSWEEAEDADMYTLDVANNPGFTDLLASEDQLESTSAVVNIPSECRPFYWRVRAMNESGETVSDTFAFSGPSPADQNNDNLLDFSDFNAWIGNFLDGDLKADVNNDDLLDFADFNAWLMAFFVGDNDCGL